MNTPMHRLTLGDFELTAISDGIYHLDGGVFFGVVPKVMWERKVKADEKNLVPSGLNSVVVRTSKKTVLIETGLGNKLPERLVKNYGQPSELLTNLTAAGTSPEDIDIVINTHLHCESETRLSQLSLTPNITCRKGSGSMLASNTSAMPSATSATTTIR